MISFTIILLALEGCLPVRYSERVRRVEWLDEPGTRRECVGHWTLYSHGAHTDRLGRIEFTWYPFGRLKSGCYLTGIRR